MLRAVGRKSFDELCRRDCRISTALGESLVKVAAQMTRSHAIGVGQTKAIALVDLAAATPARDTPAGLGRRKALALPSGEIIAPHTASAQVIEHAAVEVRHAEAAKRHAPRRGRTTTAEERALAASLEKKLHALGIRAAKVTAVATKPGRGGDVRIEHVPLAKLASLEKALAETR